MKDTARKTHPMIIVAASAVTVASLAAIANFTGLLPGKSTPETALTATAEPAAAEAAPVATQAPAAPAKTQRFDPPPPPRASKSQQAVRNAPPPTGDLRYASERTTTAYQDQGNDAGIDVIPARPAAATPPLCRDCGTVEAVHEMTTPAEGSGLGAVAGGVVGGLLGNQIGRGKGNTAATIVGAVGGAFAGHQTEKYVRSEKNQQVTVRFEDGSTRTFSQADNSRWQVGDRVRLNNGTLLPN